MDDHPASPTRSDAEETHADAVVAAEASKAPDVSSHHASAWAIYSTPVSTWK
ncbi:hypothetical protein [Pantoea sp. OXWO6B1]|uniref:hypothetical protein n=1 Tax=Pantoea sp. OXWO6B1 TaxID=1835724 RepID=UPI0012E8882E|nr:hypothetical protein [Pantoea sp. OXWO6B1]